MEKRKPASAAEGIAAAIQKNGIKVVKP